MPAKYHIPVHAVKPRFARLRRCTIVEWGDECKRCVQCVRWSCPVEAYRQGQRQFLGEIDRLLTDAPDQAAPGEIMGGDQVLETTTDICRSCYRCVQGCPRQLYLMVLNPQYDELGDHYWTPDVITTTWYQAETGRIPVSGAGYGGPFARPGFDSIWTDMSEIVRPTRDGIHGREYISTAIDLGRKPLFLVFNEEGGLAFTPPPVLEVPLPVLLGDPPLGAAPAKVRQALVQAARTLGTLAIVARDSIDKDLEPLAPPLLPSYTAGTLDLEDPLLPRVRIVELLDHVGVLEQVEALKRRFPGLLVCIKVPGDGQAVARVAELTAAGAEVLHLYADDQAQGLGEARDLHLKDLIRGCHLRLVQEQMRDTVTLLVSGGIALAEHLAKAIICGADGVVVDIPLLLALECRLCRQCAADGPCPVELEKISLGLAAQRQVNLMGAWNNQLLEILGAMGMREVRRLRGEVGRALFKEDLEREIFAPLFAQREPEALKREPT